MRVSSLPDRISVGLITDARQAEEIVASGKAELGATVEAPPQYWRAPPHGHKDLFGPTAYGAR